MSVTTPSVTPVLSDVITYVRRILKQPNAQDISDNTIADYVARFISYDMPARIQLFDLKTQYSLELTPNVDQYDAPVTYLPGGAVIPTYNSFLVPAYCDGYHIVMEQTHAQWFKLFPNYMQNGYQQNGTGFSGTYTFTIANGPIVKGHRDQNIQPPNNTTVPFGLQEGLLTSSVYITAIDLNGNLNVVQDDPTSYASEGFPTTYATGNLIQFDPLNPANTPSIVGQINYLTGAVTDLNFLYAIPTTSAINTQAIPYSAGRPQGLLFFDNTFTFRPIPSMPYLFQIDAYYNPAAFLATTNAIPYRWMAEYFARGAARKILQDYGDVEQMTLYEPFFREQENFVLRRTYRTTSNTRVATIYQGQTGYNTGNINGL